MYTYGDLTALISTGYVLLFIIVAGLAAWLMRGWLWKTVALAVVAGAFAYPLIQARVEEQERLERNRTIAERFTKLCKERAGEKINRTVHGVDGFLIIRPRTPTSSMREYLDQYWMGDPYGHSDLEAEKPEYVFLYDRKDHQRRGTRVEIFGYDFVELAVKAEPVDKKHEYVRIEARRRYSDEHGQQRVEVVRHATATPKSRYGYEWEDISTKEDREYWTAGGRMRIVDLSTGEIIAERTGYVIDLEQGARIGGGIPWLLAQRHACPPFTDIHTKAKEFVSRVLRPAREKSNE